MSTRKKIILLPENIVQSFFNNFDIHEFLIHFHNVTKQKIIKQSALNYNFSAFLTLDKSRKIIRKKQNQFITEIVGKIKFEISALQKKKVPISQLFTISFIELEKFIEIFEQRKKQFLYFQKAAKSIQEGLHLCEKMTKKNLQTIEKMRKTLGQFEQDLQFLLRKYQQKTCISFVAFLKPKYKINVVQTQKKQVYPVKTQQIASKSFISIHQHASKTLSTQQKQNTSTQAPKKSQTTKKISPMCDDSPFLKTIQSYKNQIAELKSKYYRLSCKTDGQYGNRKANNRKNASKTLVTEFETQPDSVECNSKKIQQETTNASEMKFSIRLKCDKKNSKASLSIFDKSTHNASFFKSVTNAKTTAINQNPDQQSQLSIGSRPSKFLLKKSSINKKNSINFNNNGDDTYKKGNNSVYRQTNFSIEAKRKSDQQKRVSTAKVRDSMFKDQKYGLRKSQTEADVETQNNQENDIAQVENFIEETEEVNHEKKEGAVTIDVAFEGEDDSDNQSEINSINGAPRKTRKGKNRRKGFSKKHIDCDDDNQSNFVPTILQIKRKSSIWNQGQKKQRSFNRTSFFRTSGYIQKKTLMKIGKTRFNAMGRKLAHKDSKTLFDEIPTEQTQKTIRHKVLSKHRSRKCIKGPNQFSIGVEELKKLNQQIFTQSKDDEQLIFENQLFFMMRQKYDTKYRPITEEENAEQYQGKILRAKFSILEGQGTQAYNSNPKWKKCSEIDEIKFSNVAIRKANQLGQKQLSKQKYAWWDQVKIEL